MLFKLRDKDKKVNFRSKMNNRKRLKKNLKKIKGSSQSLNVFVFSFFNPVGCYSTAKIMFTFVVPLALSTYQLVKNVPLMDMNGDKGLKLSTFHFGQFLCRNFDQLIQHAHEKLISFFHDLP